MHVRASAILAKALDKPDGFSEFAPFYDHGAEGAIDMAGYKLATYQSTDGPRAGLVIDDKVFDAAKLTGKGAYTTVLGILEDWRTAKGVLRKAAAGKSRVKA